MNILFVLFIFAFALTGCGGGAEDHSLDTKLMAQRAGSANSRPRPSFLAASGGTTNLLLNANFESGETGWTASFAVLSTDSTVAHGGSKYAWLGGYDNAEDTVHQDVAIPAGAQQVYIQFWYQILTKETSTTTARDTMTLDVFNTGSDTRLATLKTYSNRDKTTGWVQSAQFDLSAYKGKTVRLKFTALTDTSNETSFLIDDVTVALTASASSDIVYFSGKRANYTITKTSTGYTVRDNVGSEGTQTFTNAKLFRFADMEVALGTNGTAGKVFRLYQAAFNRQPDSAGLGYQIASSDTSGLTLTQLSENFINSPEFLNSYGNLNNTEFVKRLYQNVLHRAAETAGLEFHVNNLDAHRVSKAELLLAFSESAENQTQLQGLIENGISYTPYVAPSAPTTTTTPPTTTPPTTTATGSNCTYASILSGTCATSTPVTTVGNVDAANYPQVAHVVQCFVAVGQPTANTNTMVTGGPCLTQAKSVESGRTCGYSQSIRDSNELNYLQCLADNSTGTYHTRYVDGVADLKARISNTPKTCPTGFVLTNFGMCVTASAGSTSTTTTPGNTTTGDSRLRQGGLVWTMAASKMPWSQARAYCGTTINGQTGWRLPTMTELRALYLSGAMNGWGWPLADTWSSSLGDYPSSHTTVSLGSLYTEDKYDTFSYLVACVHAGS